MNTGQQLPDRIAIGIDIGGANLKIARSDGWARSYVFELWRQPEQLAGALRRFLPDVPLEIPVGITMTGELCDCFETKEEGVRRILNAVEEAYPGRALRVWGTDGTWRGPDAARSSWREVAAANWYALACFCTRFTQGQPTVLIDTGSTTTDIIPILRKPIPRGSTDPERLRSGELVYTGARRTPVCAVLQERVAAEWFATVEDAYLLLGHIPEMPDNCDTADRRPATRWYAHGRLSRMLGGDPRITPESETRQLAEDVFLHQRALILRGLQCVLASLGEPVRVIIVSGSGEFLARAAWDHGFVEHPEWSAGTPLVVSLSELLGPETSSAACAYAVAKLLTESTDDARGKR